MGSLLILAGIRATGPDPVIDFRELEFPEAANLVGRKSTVVDPAIHGILGDPEVLGDLFDRGPWLSQWNVLPQLRSLRQYGMSKGILAGRIWQESDKVGYCL